MSGPPESVLSLIDADLAYADQADEALRRGPASFADFQEAVTGSMAFRYSADLTHQLCFGTRLDEDAWRAERGLAPRVKLR